MRVGRYELGRLLGEGGMGSVHEAAHVVTGKRVAVKLLKPEVMAVPGALERFLTEARAACGVDHPNVVDVLDVDVEDGAAYMVIELLDGESLEERLERGPMSVTELWSVAEPLLEALAKAHERGILHRDLKPANIFLATDAAGRPLPKLLDFGIAKLLGADELSLTATGHMVGTPLYMPPEIIAGEKSARPQCDVYSFAAVCYEALAGHPPHQAQTLPQLLVAVSSADPAPLEERGIPEPVAAVIRQGMARDPEARFESADDFARALREAVDQAPEDLGLAATAPSIRPGSLPAPTPPAPTRGPRTGLWAFGALAAVLIGVGAYLGLAEPEPDDVSEAAAVAEPPAPPPVEPEPPAVPEPDPSAEAADLPAAIAPPEPETVGMQASSVEPPGTRRSDPATMAAAAEVEPDPEPAEPEPEPLRVEGDRSGGLSADEF